MMSKMEFRDNDSSRDTPKLSRESVEFLMPKKEIRKDHSIRGTLEHADPCVGLIPDVQKGK